MTYPDPASPKNKALSVFEREIRELADNTPGVTFGYIGNFERWGDDRALHIWVNGSQISLWSCAAIQLTKREVSRARWTLSIFKHGYEAAVSAAP